MSNIRISTDEVANTASQIRALSQSMYDELTEMKKEMNALEGTWISDGSAEIRNRFALFAARFEKHKQEIDRYAAFLDLTASSYDTLESAITGNASGIQY